MDVGFHFNFGLGWEGRGLVSGSLLFGVGLLFYIVFGWGVGVVLFEILSGQILFIFLKILFNFFSVSCDGT